MLEPHKITLRAARVLSGYTIKAAATHAGITASSLGRYERNPEAIHLSKAIELVRLYGTTIDELVFIK